MVLAADESAFARTFYKDAYPVWCQDRLNLEIIRDDIVATSPLKINLRIIPYRSRNRWSLDEYVLQIWFWIANNLLEE
jgi:hypothetical protein